MIQVSSGCWTVFGFLNHGSMDYNGLGEKIFTGNPAFYHQILSFPVDFSSIQWTVQSPANYDIWEFGIQLMRIPETYP